MGHLTGSGRTRRRLAGTRVASALLAAALAIGLVPGVQAAPRAEPKVVLVVGPAGGLTSEYRAAAEAGARVARRYTHNVVTIYSPNATWPVVKAALQGASIVVYLGHGNGWPSRYRDQLYPPTQNGLGLNPVAGQDNVAHQYFGEAYLAKYVHLAPHAVVLLHHLCYASGNTEPGLPEGTLSDSRQRVDNYGAGWLAAGADSVLADAFFGPAWYLEAILGGSGSIESIWRRAPSFHDHVIGYPSRRVSGRNVLLDPTTPRHGFYRSLVGKLTLRPSDVLKGAGQARGGGSRGGGSTTPSTVEVPPPLPTPTPAPAMVRAEFAPPAVVPSAGVSSGLVAGSTVTVALPFKLPAGSEVSGTFQLGFRWDPLVLDPPQAVPDGASQTPSDPAASPAPTASQPPIASPAPSDPAAPTASQAPTASPAPTASQVPTASRLPTASPARSAPAASSPRAPSSPPASAAPLASALAASPIPSDPAASQAPLDPAAPLSPSDPAGPTQAPAIDFVVPETPGDVVTTVPATVVAGMLVATVSLPVAPGRYRLRTTVHDAGGSALDATTQARIAPLVVRVSPPVSVAFGVAGNLSLTAGTRMNLPVRVANDGARPWFEARPPTDVPASPTDVPASPSGGDPSGTAGADASGTAGADPSGTAGADPASLVMATWVAIGAGVDTSGLLTATQVRLAPGAETTVELPLLAPDQPGSYLVLLDLMSPTYGSLAAAGVNPTIIRVQVIAAAPTPGPGLHRTGPIDR